jgi:hypothetical protein
MRIAGGTVSWPLAALAQQPSMPVIGFLNSASADAYRTFWSRSDAAPGGPSSPLPLCATSILNERLTHIDGGVSRVSLTSMAVSPVQPRATDPLACDGEAHASMLDCRTVLSSGIKMRVTLGGEKASGCDYFGVIMISTAASGPRRSRSEA